MKAVIYREYATLPKLEDLPDPTPKTHGVVLRVKATGLCRSDWHGCDSDKPILEAVSKLHFASNGCVAI